MISNLLYLESASLLSTVSGLRVVRDLDGFDDSSYKAVVKAAQEYSMLDVAGDRSAAELNSLLVPASRYDSLSVEAGGERTAHARLYMPLAGAEVIDLLPKKDVFSWEQTYKGLMPPEVVTVDVELLARGSVRMRYRDVFTGGSGEQYGYEFVAMTEHMFKLARAAYPGDRDFVKRRTLHARMFLLGQLIGPVVTDDMLVRLCELPGNVLRLARMVNSGDFNAYVNAGLPLAHVVEMYGNTMPVLAG